MTDEIHPRINLLVNPVINEKTYCYLTVVGLVV